MGVWVFTHNVILESKNEGRLRGTLIVSKKWINNQECPSPVFKMYTGKGHTVGLS